MAQSTPTLGLFIQEEMQRRKLSLREFATLAGVTHPTMSKFSWYGIHETYGGRIIGEPPLEFLAKLAKATGHDICTLVALVRPDATRLDPRASILTNRIMQLPPEKLQLFTTFMRGLGFDEL